jgi:hypothetical protein
MRRIIALEAKAVVSGTTYEDHAVFLKHEVYALGADGVVMGIPSLNTWPEEGHFWNLHAVGTRFLRLSAKGAEEVIDGQVRTVRFRPFALTQDARRVRDELYRSIVEERPEMSEDATP